MYINVTRLKDIRKDRDLSQKDIAKILGTSQVQYSRYEMWYLQIIIMYLLITYLDLQMKENLIQKQNKNVKKPVIRFTNHWFLLTSYMLFPVYFLF